MKQTQVFLVLQWRVSRDGFEMFEEGRTAHTHTSGKLSDDKGFAQIWSDFVRRCENPAGRGFVPHQFLKRATMLPD